MSGQTKYLRLFSYALFSGALACGEAENLSVGELRCEGVSCAPSDVEWVEASERVEVEDVERDELLFPLREAAFCSNPPPLSLLANDVDDGPAHETICRSEAMIAVGDHDHIVATSFTTSIDAKHVVTGVRLARFEDGVLVRESTELSRETKVVPNSFSDSFAIASTDTAGEAIVGVTREAGGYGSYGQTFYALDDDGELSELFEDPTAGRVRALATLGEDIVVVSDYEQRLELTRYTAQGVVVWRQTTLAVVEYPAEGATALEFASMRVLDGERIFVLVPRASLYELLELTAEGELVRTWTNWGYSQDEYYGARLAVAPGGQLVVGVDGYQIKRASLVGGEPRVDLVVKDRTQYYTPAMHGLSVDGAGYVYVATIDGARDDGYSLLERISPDLTQRESFVLERDGQPFVILGDMFVTEDQRTLYFASRGTVGKLELPPIED
jgi:hypothetical protein